MMADTNAYDETSYRDDTDHGNYNATEYNSQNEYYRGDDNPNDNEDREDIAELHFLCESATEEDPESWNDIREYIQANMDSMENLKEAAEYVGDFQTIALHLACRKHPPLDIVHTLLDIAPDTVGWEDAFGWLPLHHACGYGADDKILQILVEVYPSSTCFMDKKQRTPLHFALGNAGNTATSKAVILLSSTGAASFPDSTGMLPLHYACAYGASEEALEVLIEAFPESITAADANGRTPLHYAMGNCDRVSSPAVIKLLISHDRTIVDFADTEGGLPLNLLTSRSTTIDANKEKERGYAIQCLNLYVDANPVPTADFLMALIALPDWLRDIVVVKTTIQDMLNERIAQKLLSFFLLLDLYSRIGLISVFYLASWYHLRTWAPQVQNYYDINSTTYEDQCPSPSADGNLQYILYGFIILFSFWVFFREVIQIVSLLALGSVKNYYKDVYNIIDLLTFLLPIIGVSHMWLKKEKDHYSDTELMLFRGFVVLTLLLGWVSLLSSLRRSQLQIAIFVGGVIHIFVMLVKFMITLVIIMVAFANIFYTININHFPEETNDVDDNDNSELCESIKLTDDNPGLSGESGTSDFCKCYFWTPPGEDANFGGPAWWDSFFMVYTMLLGVTDDKAFEDLGVAALIFFALFFFLVVIILGNILIAIVTDSYSFIKDERAAVVFWTNRMEFVAEMNAIIFLCCGNKQNTIKGKEDTYLGRAWDKMGEFFENAELQVFSINFFIIMLLRILTIIAYLVILVLGVCTAGLLWPPQIRKFCFVEKTSKVVGMKEKERLAVEVNLLKNELRVVQKGLANDMSSDKEKLNDVRLLVSTLKRDMHNEMKEVKKAVELLFQVE